MSDERGDLGRKSGADKGPRFEVESGHNGSRILF